MPPNAVAKRNDWHAIIALGRRVANFTASNPRERGANYLNGWGNRTRDGAGLPCPDQSLVYNDRRRRRAVPRSIRVGTHHLDRHP